MTETFRYHDSKWCEDRDVEFQAAQRRRDEREYWPTKHPRCCPFCGRPESVHEELGGCPYFLGEEDDNGAYSEEGDDYPDLEVFYQGGALQLRPIAVG